MDPFALIIFGITGNLSAIKLLPALYDLEEHGLLPEEVTIIGTARDAISREDFAKLFDNALHQENRHHQHPINPEVAKKLLSRISYMHGDLTDPKFYSKLKTELDQKQNSCPSCRNRIFYLATYPNLYQTIFSNLRATKLNNQDEGWSRLMIEKPIGHDLASAKELDKLLNQYFNEDQIYRLDHYLGKETLQNILTFRFGNCIFEPLINKEFVDHIQVTAAEDFGIGSRGGYYDETGHLKDVGQNHLLQMLAFSTMENPNEFSNVAITQKRIDILNALKADPKKLVLGQYDGYRSELHVKSNSQTNTFFAFRTEISNDRFRGVPIYVRGGKKMKQTATEISIVFKNRPNRLHLNLPSGEEPNVLIYRIQPNEAIVLKVLSKMPGLNTALEPSYMQFCYKHLLID